MNDIEELKRRRDAVVGDITYDELAFWMADNADSIIDAITTLQRENDILRAERNHERARREACVRILSRINSFISPKDVKLPDGRRFEFNNPAIEHEMLKALSEAIRAVPDDLKKAETAQPEDEWHGY